MELNTTVADGIKVPVVRKRVWNRRPRKHEDHVELYMTKEKNTHCVSGLGTRRLGGLGSGPHRALDRPAGGLPMSEAVDRLGEGWMAAGVRGELG